MTTEILNTEILSTEVIEATTFNEKTTIIKLSQCPTLSEMDALFTDDSVILEF